MMMMTRRERNKHKIKKNCIHMNLHLRHIIELPVIVILGLYNSNIKDKFIYSILCLKKETITNTCKTIKRIS